MNDYDCNGSRVSSTVQYSTVQYSWCKLRQYPDNCVLSQQCNANYCVAGQQQQQWVWTKSGQYIQVGDT